MGHILSGSGVGVTCRVLLMLLIIMAAVGVGVTLRKLIAEIFFAVTVVSEILTVVKGLTDSGVLMRIFELTNWVVGEVVGKMVDVHIMNHTNGS